MWVVTVPEEMVVVEGWGTKDCWGNIYDGCWLTLFVSDAVKANGGVVLCKGGKTNRFGWNKIIL